MGRETVAALIAIIAAFCWTQPLMLTTAASTLSHNGADFGPLGFGLLIMPVLTALSVSASKDHLAILFGSSQLALLVIFSSKLANEPSFWLHGLGIVAGLALMQAMEHAPIVAEKFGDSSLSQTASNTKYF